MAKKRRKSRKSRKTHRKGHVPLRLLERRLKKLNAVVKKRGGHHY